MKRAAKIILTLSLIILLLLACISVLFAGYTGLWLHTYKVFTQKTAVAEVVISAEKTDENGTYTDVGYTPMINDSALETFFGMSSRVQPSVQNYKLYGDVIYIGGPIVKFKDELILFNFRTIYKVAKIYSRYDINNQLELDKNEEARKQSSYDIERGYEDWKSISDNYKREDLFGQIYRGIFDTPQISSPGMFVGAREEKYILYITNTGFMWELQLNR